MLCASALVRRDAIGLPGLTFHFGAGRFGAETRQMLASSSAREVMGYHDSELERPIGAGGAFQSSPDAPSTSAVIAVTL